VTEEMTIEARHRAHWAQPAALIDFRCGRARSVGIHDIDRSKLSLYCWDHPSRRGVFVELDDVDRLANAPFFYRHQFEHAVRLFAVPFEELESLVPVEPAGLRLVFVLSVGRCGSTLVSRMFQRIAGVVSLSEPDVFTNLTMVRAADRSQDAELVSLLRVIVPNLLAVRDPSATWVIKLRAWSTGLGDLIHRAFPHARLLFLYRDAESCVESYVRAFPEGWLKGRVRDAVHAPDPMGWRDPRLVRTLPPDLQLDTVIGYTLNWLSMMACYRELYAKGVPMLALRYDDLVADPRGVFAEVLGYAGLRANDLAIAMPALEEDSQGGTEISRGSRRGRGLTARDRARLHRFLDRYATIRSGEILPGTLSIGSASPG
jgi:hypothetical protein